MDNRTLQLESNEYLVYSEGESTVNIKDDEFKFFISNINLIFLKEITYLFKKSTYEVIKMPIEKIKIISDIPQIKVEQGDYKSWNLVIFFDRGSKKVEFYYESILGKNHRKKHVEQIANMISDLSIKINSDSKSMNKEEVSIEKVANKNSNLSSNYSRESSSHSSGDQKILKKKGFMNYDTIRTPNAKYYIDYELRMFAVKDFSGIKILKFKDFKGYSIDYDNPKSSTSVHYGGGMLNGAIQGNFLGKSILGKSAARVGAIAGGLAKGIANTHINFGGKLAARVVFRYRTHNTTIELSDLSSLEAYRPLFDMLDKISTINSKK